MKRGTDWEEKIELALDDMITRNIEHTIVKTEAPVRVIHHVKGAQFLGVFVAPGMCDFEGGYRGVPVCVETKETSLVRLPLTDKKYIKTGQILRLDQTLKMRGIAGLLVRFRPPTEIPECWGIPWSLAGVVRESGVRSFKMKELGALGAMKFRSPIGTSAEELEEFLDHCLALAKARR